MIRVLNVVVDNHIGGIQNRILNIGPGLKERGIELVLLSPKGEGDFADTASRSGFTVHQTAIRSPKFFDSYRNFLRNAFWALSFPLGVIETIGVIRRENIEIVHVNGVLALHAAIAARITGIPLIWHLISPFYPRLLITSIRPLYLRWAEKVILITNNTADYYLGDNYDTSRVEVIYEPIDIEKFDNASIPRSVRAEKRAALNISPECKVIGFVGNISPQKGLETYLRVARGLKDKSTGLMKFLIVGEASATHQVYKKGLEDLTTRLGLDDDIIFAGKVQNLQEVLSVMDIFLMTSRSEGTPLVILEAMAMEIPVVAPDVGGIAEQISDGVTGYVVPPGDVDASVNCLSILLDDPNLRDTMGRMGRERVSALFSLEKCIRSHEHLYEETKMHRKLARHRSNF